MDKGDRRATIPLHPHPGNALIWLLRSAMTDLMPRVGDMPGLQDCEPDAFLLKLRSETTFVTWIGLCAGAVLWLWTPFLTVYIPLPAVMLSANARDRHVNGLTTTRIYLLRQAMFLVKMYASMCWGQHPSVRRQFNVAAYPVDPGTFRTT